MTTRRLPPSQRDRDSLAAMLRQTDRLARSQAGPGFYGGRLALPQPIPGSDYTDALIDDDDGDSDDDADLLLPVYEPYDPLTRAEVAAGVSAGVIRHQLAHAGIVEDRAIRCHVNASEYPPTALEVDSENGVATLVLGGWETAEEAIWFEYWYHDQTVNDATIPAPVPPPDPEPVNFTVIGYTSGDGAHSAVPFHGGAAEGDLFLYACSAVLSGQTNECADARVTAQVVNAALSSCSVRAWVGTVTDPSTALAAHATQYTNGASETGWALLVIRPDTPTDWDLTKITDSGNQGSGSIPGMSGVSGAVGLGFSRGGLGGGGAHSWPAPWVTGAMNHLGGTYAVISFATQVNSGTIAAVPAIEPDDPWRGYLLGVALG